MSAAQSRFGQLAQTTLEAQHHINNALAALIPCIDTNDEGWTIVHEHNAVDVRTLLMRIQTATKTVEDARNVLEMCEDKVDATLDARLALANATILQLHRDNARLAKEWTAKLDAAMEAIRARLGGPPVPELEDVWEALKKQAGVDMGATRDAGEERLCQVSKRDLVAAFTATASATTITAHKTAPKYTIEYTLTATTDGHYWRPGTKPERAGDWFGPYESETAAKMAAEAYIKDVVGRIMREP